MHIRGEIMVNVNLGTPYEIILENAIKQGYAGNSTEAIRQALLVYEKELEKREEVMCLNVVGKINRYI